MDGSAARGRGEVKASLDDPTAIATADASGGGMGVISKAHRCQGARVRLPPQQPLPLQQWPVASGCGGRPSSEGGGARA